ncbi:uncharacterized protein LOC134761655 [Pongo abelii]|uniref:uncharacterized protein LOC134761655 n=1 Tax=Pongo abelii TaxID=9601 RepID=UPI0030079F11
MTQVIPVLPSQRLQLLILDLVQALSPGLAAVGDLLVLGLDLSNDAVHVQGPAVVHGQHHRCVPDLGLQLLDLLFIQVLEEVDLIIQPFQARLLQLYLVHSSTSPGVLPNLASSFSFSWPSVSSCCRRLTSLLNMQSTFIQTVFCCCRRLQFVSSTLFCCSRNHTLLIKEANLLLMVLICSFSWVHVAWMLGSTSSLRGYSRL